jgi:DegV family protein with EDD domain
MKIKLMVDSTFKLEESFVLENKIDVIPLNVIIDGNTYRDGIDISFDEVMEAANDGKKVSTSQPSPALFQQHFEKLRDEGVTDIICMTISSTLSGTFQAANIAKNEVEGVNIHLIDTLSASLGSEILARITVEEIKKETPLEDIVEKINRVKANSGILMSMENLNALKKSGRINKIKATIGNLLRVKPIIEYLNGKVNINSKLRTEKQVAEWIVEKMKSVLDGIQTTIHIFVAYVQSIERLNHVLIKLKEAFPNINIVMRDGITPVVAINLGYGGLGVAWCYE